VGVVGYNVFRGSTLIDTPAETSYTETGLAPNTSYHYNVSAYDAAGGVSARSPTAASCTLAQQPTSSTVTCDKPAGVWQTSGPFTFTSVGGFGQGYVNYYRYAWDTSPTHTWTGSETSWPSGTLPCAAETSALPYYLHIRSYNQQNLTGDPVDFGPFYVAFPPVVTDDGAYTTTRTSVHAIWTTNEPPITIFDYRVAVGTTPGGSNIVAWTDTHSTSSDGKYNMTQQAVGTTVYLSVQAQNELGMWGNTGTSNGITMAKSVASVIAAKALADGQAVRISGRTVSAVFGDCFYVQDSPVKTGNPWITGIRCDGICPYAVGTKVYAGGWLSLNAAHERTLAAAEATPSP
jgi:hypothetical protein